MLLCAYYSFATLSPQHLAADAGTWHTLARFIAQQLPDANVLIVVRNSDDDRTFATAIQQSLKEAGIRTLGTVAGEPREVVAELRRLGAAETKVDVIVTHNFFASRTVLGEPRLKELASEFPSLANNIQVLKPSSYTWPTFLTRGNLLSVGNQVAVTAIIAIAMTMVIITAGIDLSVGSLMALSGVMAAWTIQRLVGDGDPGMMTLALACIATVLLCAAIGFLTGVMVTAFDIPAFIVTLAVMRIARGLACKVAGGPSPIGIESAAVSQLERRNIVWHSQSRDLDGRAVHPRFVILMSHTVSRAVHLRGERQSGSGSDCLVYRCSECCCLCTRSVERWPGVGGVMDAPLFSVGNPNSCTGYELLIIAAVVVGGTSLMGGKGEEVVGTLISALILAVISNGTYALTKVDSYTADDCLWHADLDRRAA